MQHERSAKKGQRHATFVIHPIKQRGGGIGNVTNWSGGGGATDRQKADLLAVPERTSARTLPPTQLRRRDQ